VRIPNSPNIRIAAGLLLAALLSIVGYQVFRRRSSQAPEALLKRADDLSWLNAWVQAEPLYRQAELKFRAEGNLPRTLYARVSQIPAESESSTTIPDQIAGLRLDLELPEARDPETRLRILTILGMLETNYDAGMARDTWSEVEKLALRRRHYLLASRASGEQGIAAFLLGDMTTAKKDVLRAWLVAKVADPAAHIRYASMYGAGLVEIHKYKEALGPLNEAIRVSQKTPEIAYPTIAITAKIDALSGLGENQQALALAAEETRKGNADLPLAQRLFDGLLGGIPEYRTNSDLILVPDGKLHLLPFAALADSGQYLAASHTVSVAPSGTVLDLLRHRDSGTAPRTMPYIGVAAWISKPPPITLIASIRRAISGPDRRQLVALPESRNEVESIATDFPPPRTILLGAQATETDFKRLPLERYEVIHLALHGYADPEYPDRSALVFAPETPPIDDGLLQVREIRHLHLNADLVTLSACDTGVGQVGEEGVADIENAFIEAGAQSVVSALWGVNDQATADLMIDFYRQLGRGKSKAAALKQAQLDMLKSGQPPSSWAGFELDGEPDGSLFQRTATDYSLRSSTR